MEIEEFLSIVKTAKLLGVTPQTIRRWAKDGKIQETRSPTDRRLFSICEVKRMMGVRAQGFLAWDNEDRCDCDDPVLIYTTRKRKGDPSVSVPAAEVYKVIEQLSPSDRKTVYDLA
ncbi:MAG: MerR family DNA-binding transcriptional regulator, partial [Firmicutes bacterium]|nr:MerR family DNA-binding transcriptional regulator [Bacillota bacterium]